jgi:hypothetical protein
MSTGFPEPPQQISVPIFKMVTTAALSPSSLAAFAAARHVECPTSAPRSRDPLGPMEYNGRVLKRRDGGEQK